MGTDGISERSTALAGEDYAEFLQQQAAEQLAAARLFIFYFLPLFHCDRCYYSSTYRKTIQEKQMLCYELTTGKTICSLFVHKI